MKVEMTGVREYAEEMPVKLYIHSNGRLVVEALNSGGQDGVDIDLLDLIAWLHANRPDLLAVPAHQG